MNSLGAYVLADDLVRPFACDKLTIWTLNQMIAWGVGEVAKTLNMPKENVRLISPFVGGGFGAGTALQDLSNRRCHRKHHDESRASNGQRLIC